MSSQAFIKLFNFLLIVCFLFCLLVVCTCALICLVILMDGFSSLIFIYWVFFSLFNIPIGFFLFSF